MRTVPGDTARGAAARSGAALLEVLLALAILASLGASAAWRAQEWMDAVRRTFEEEEAVRGAQRLITAASLWPRDDLDRHVGVTVQGPWRLQVQPDGPTLYALAVLDGSTGFPLLETVVYRSPADR